VPQPSVDPELMMRMLIVGYCCGIRSELRLCEEVHLNLAHRRFCRLGLDGEVPDHSTFSRNRHGRFRRSDILRHLFETVAEGLVGGEGLAVDGSLVAADANKQRSILGDQWQAQDHSAHASRAVREHLAALDDAAFRAASPVRPMFVCPLRSGGATDGRSPDADIRPEEEFKRGTNSWDRMALHEAWPRPQRCGEKPEVPVTSSGDDLPPPRSGFSAASFRVHPNCGHLRSRLNCAGIYDCVEHLS
jgi:Transposase domain (DUF772)